MTGDLGATGGRLRRAPTGRRVRAWLLLALSAASASLFLSSRAAFAQDPIDFGPGHLFDQADVLSEADADTIETAVTSLYVQHRITLYVVYAEHFSTPADVEDWANDTAAQNALEDTDYLLAVATDQHAYYLSGDSTGPVSDEQLASIEQHYIEPKLRSQDWAQAAVAAANGLGGAIDSGSRQSAFVWVCLFSALVAASITIVLVRRRAIPTTTESTPKRG